MRMVSKSLLVIIVAGLFGWCATLISHFTDTIFNHMAGVDSGALDILIEPMPH